MIIAHSRLELSNSGLSLQKQGRTDRSNMSAVNRSILRKENVAYAYSSPQEPVILEHHPVPTQEPLHSKILRVDPTYLRSSWLILHDRHSEKEIFIPPLSSDGRDGVLKKRWTVLEHRSIEKRVAMAEGAMEEVRNFSKIRLFLISYKEQQSKLDCQGNWE